MQLADLLPHRRTDTVCWLAVQDDPIAFIHVPIFNRTPEMCLYVVQQNGMLLCEVPLDVINHKICSAAVENYPRAVEFVPHNFMTAQMKILSERLATLSDPVFLL